MINESTDDEFAAEIHQFASLVRARIVGALQAASEGDFELSEAERLWGAAYGRVELQAGSLDELVEQVTEVVRRRLAAATALTIQLAMQIADSSGDPLIEIIDHAETAIADRASDT